MTIIAMLIGAIGILNFITLWSERPASGLIGAIGFGGLALVFTGGLDAALTHTGMALGLTSLAAAGMSIYIGYFAD